MNKVKLSDRLEFLYGFSVRVNDEKTGEYPVYGSNGITGFIDNYKIKGPGIIIGRKGSVGKVSFSQDNFTPTDTAYYVQIKDNTKDNLKFWFYYLPLFGLEKLNTHSSVPGLSREIAYMIDVNPPNLKTQSAIADVLSSLDDKIELNNKINKELENMAKTVYEYWFVQNADKRWEKKKLIELGVGIIRGVTYNKNDIKTVNDKNVIGILRATNINGNIIDLNNLVYVDKSLVSENQKLQPFDIMITMSSGSKEHIGKNGLFCFNNANAAFGAFCSKIDVEEKFKIYLYQYFQSQIFKSYVKNCCLGTNINNLNNEIIKDILITVPSTEILQKFNKAISPIFSAIIKKRQELANLAQLRDFLLPLLMNGQVKVNRD